MLSIDARIVIWFVFSADFCGVSHYARRRAASLAAGAPPATTKTADPLENPAEHIVVVRVYDRYDKVGSGKTVVRGK